MSCNTFDYIFFDKTCNPGTGTNIYFYIVPYHRPIYFPFFRPMLMKNYFYIELFLYCCAGLLSLKGFEIYPAGSVVFALQPNKVCGCELM